MSVWSDLDDPVVHVMKPDEPGRENVAKHEGSFKAWRRWTPWAIGGFLILTSCVREATTWWNANNT